MIKIGSSIRFASAFVAFAALTSACAVEPSPAPPPVGSPIAYDTAGVATAGLRVDASAQAYGGDLAVYARLYDAHLTTLPLGAGDALVATVGGTTRPMSVNEQGDYVTTFPMPAGAVDVEIRFERPSDKTSAALIVHVPGAFRVVSSPAMLRADAPIVFRVDPPLPAGARASVRFKGNCFFPFVGEPVVLAARAGADGSITLDPSAFDFYRSPHGDVECSALVGVRFESYAEPSVGFAKSSALGLEERGYDAYVVIPQGP